ncbi:acyltransferase [Clostridium butyricum]|uniref:acyltransferase n=1 Tax=Clostridium butyricum TaxID=1492 RepID=UPI0022E425CB|nr:acyltransferase [Clostridium butyricum]
MIKSILEHIKVCVLGYKATSKSYINHLKKSGVLIGENIFIYRPMSTTIDLQNPHLLKIGNNVMMTGPVTILTHDYSWSVLKNKYGVIAGNQNFVTIGNNVFIGWGATILAGTTIGDNVVIGANSVVKGNVNSNSVYAGNPARYIMNIQEYFNKRVSKQLEEAVIYVLRYKERFGVVPPIEKLDEYFFLFTSGDNKNYLKKYDYKLNLMMSYDKSIEYLLKNQPMFSCYDEFIKFCLNDENNK